MRALLDRAATSRTGRAEANRVLSFPWCQPPAGHPLHGKALSLGFAPRSPSPGEVLLAAVHDDDDGAGSLWAFSRGPIPLSGSALAALELAQWIVQRDLAGWRVPPSGQAPPAVVQCLAWSSQKRPVHVTGASFGGALLLAIVSQGLQQPVPGDLVVLAALGAGGLLEPVDGLQTKLRVLDEWAPGVRRCLVAPAQLDAARRLAPHLDIQATKSAHELVDAVFPEPPTMDVEVLAKRLFQVAMSPDRGPVSWRQFQQLAVRTAATAEASSAARWYAGAASAIAERHSGGPLMPLPAISPSSPLLARPLREQFLSQQIQHAADSGEPDDGLVDRARAEVPSPQESSRSQLELRGAIGRALARRREYQAAATWLGETVEAWFELGAYADSARALTEWIRVLGIRGDGASLTRAAMPFADVLTAELRAAGRNTELAFLALARARACVQLGHLVEAAPWWEDRCWEQAPTWLVESRERWRARGQWKEGDRAGARVRLEAVRGEPDIAALARVDMCLLLGTEPDAAVQDFLATTGAREAGWLLQGAHTHAERASRLHDESPY